MKWIINFNFENLLLVFYEINNNIHFQDAVFDKEKFMAIGAKCKEESGTSEDDVKKILHGQAATSTESKCMMACIFKEMGIVSLSDR